MQAQYVHSHYLLVGMYHTSNVGSSEQIFKIKDWSLRNCFFFQKLLIRRKLSPKMQFEKKI